MSANNGDGVIRVGRKGRKKFAFGEEGEPFEVDVVVAFQEWVCIDEEFRDKSKDRSIPNSDMLVYHQAAVNFVERLANPLSDGELRQPITEVTTAEALDFIARLREQYDELADFFQPRKREKDESPATLGAELRFSVEGEPSPTSTN